MIKEVIADKGKERIREKTIGTRDYSQQVHWSERLSGETLLTMASKMFGRLTRTLTNAQGGQNYIITGGQFSVVITNSDVDGNDLATLASDFDRSDCSPASPCAEDINGDGVVDLDDLGILATELGRTECPHDEYYYFHNDHLGTPQLITDQSGTVVWSANYKPFGQADITIDTITNPFCFPGQYLDPETGLHYNYFRYYDPGIGRYLRGDPLGISSKTTSYYYVSNSALSSYDIFGEREWTVYRRGISISSVVIGGSGQLVKFVSNCESSTRITKTYLVIGYGLTVGLKAQIRLNNKGYYGKTRVFGNEPSPFYTGIAISGPSGGLGFIGGTVASASLDFTSYAEVYAVSKGKILGFSIFSFEGQLYIPWGLRRVESCCEE